VFSPPAQDSILGSVFNKHGAVRPLTAPTVLQTMRWDSRLSNVALQHSRACQYQHTTNDVRNSRYNSLTGEGMSVGENIAASTGGSNAFLANASSLFDLWFTAGQSNECALYVQQGCPAVTNENFHAWGHYSQLIWAATSRVGCAYTDCTVNSPFGTSFPKWTLLVCNYASAGNFLGQRYATGSPKCDLSLCQSSVVRSELLNNNTLTTPKSKKVPLFTVVLVCAVGVVVIALAIVVSVVLIRKSQTAALKLESEQYVAMNAANCE